MEGPTPPAEEEEEEEEPEEPERPGAPEQVEIDPRAPPNVKCVPISRPESKGDRWVGPECLTLLLAATGDRTDPEYALTLDTFAPSAREAERLLVSLVCASSPPSRGRSLRRAKASSKVIRDGAGTIRLWCEELRGIPSMAERMQLCTSFYILLMMSVLRAEESFWKDVEEWLKNEAEAISGAPASGTARIMIGISSSHAYLADRLPLEVGVEERFKPFEERLDALRGLFFWPLESDIPIRNDRYRNIWLRIPRGTHNEKLGDIEQNVRELSDECSYLCLQMRENLYEKTLGRYEVGWGAEYAVSLAMGSVRDGPLVIYAASDSASAARASVMRALCLNQNEIRDLLMLTIDRAGTLHWSSGELQIYRVMVEGLNRGAGAWLNASAAFFAIPASDPVFVLEFYNGAWELILEKAPETYPTGQDWVEIEVPFLRVPPPPPSLRWPHLPSPIEPATARGLPRIRVTVQEIEEARAVLRP